MIETDQVGDAQIKELLANRNDPVFNDWEKSFISDLWGRKYVKLTKNQKACVTRLIGWLRGDQ